MLVLASLRESRLPNLHNLPHLPQTSFSDRFHAHFLVGSGGLGVLGVSSSKRTPSPPRSFQASCCTLFAVIYGRGWGREGWGREGNTTSFQPVLPPSALFGWQCIFCKFFALPICIPYWISSTFHALFLIVVAVCFPQRALENSRFWRVAENAEAGLQIDATSPHVHCSVGDASQLPNAPQAPAYAQCKQFGLPPGKSVLDTEGTKQRMEK